MWFGEPHPFPERGSPTKLSASGQQSYEGCSCRKGSTRSHCVQNRLWTCRKTDSGMNNDKHFVTCERTSLNRRNVDRPRTKRRHQHTRSQNKPGMPYASGKQRARHEDQIARTKCLLYSDVSTANNAAVTFIWNSALRTRTNRTKYEANPKLCLFDSKYWEKRTEQTQVTVSALHLSLLFSVQQCCKENELHCEHWHIVLVMRMLRGTQVFSRTESPVRIQSGQYLWKARTEINSCS